MPVLTKIAGSAAFDFCYNGYMIEESEEVDRSFGRRAMLGNTIITDYRAAVEAPDKIHAAAYLSKMVST
jgi:hypothetical protein